MIHICVSTLLDVEPIILLLIRFVHQHRKQSVSTRLTVKKLVSYTKSNLSIGGFSREGKHDIVAPIFKIRNSVVNKEEFIPL